MYSKQFGYSNGADDANRRLAAQSDAYKSTTQPLLDINKTLKEIKDLLELLVDAVVDR